MQKTNFKTRLLALLTAAFMLVMCVPFAAFAETTDPAVREKIIVNFTDADGNTTPVTIVKDAVSPTAPEAKDGKWVSDSGAPELNSGDSLTWTEMNRWAAGDWDKTAYISYSFKANEKKPEVKKHHFTVNFTVDPEKGSFTGIGAGPVVFQGYEEEVGDQQYEVPAVTAKEGYKFVGWKGQGADVIAWDAEAKTFGVTGLCFYQDGSYEGNASIEAQFEKIEDKKDDNSSSSSSSSASSSSNKTTTASNEKQVVKAAAAPANTTKVLPKTGASNVAPLLGGSLAVVALLMGYGVYSLVLRKKD